MSSPCLGFSIFGNCEYDPSLPSSIYFTLGDAAAALTITILIPQFLKPIYSFRLKASGLSTIKIYGIVICATFSVIIAALLPHMPISRNNVLTYPIFWEVVGISLFAYLYSLLALASAVPAKFKEKQADVFCIEAANFLAEANEKDYVEFAHDLHRNIVNLIKLSSFFDRYREWNAFTLFTHRRKILAAQFSAAFLRILSDQKFCIALVTKCPWLTARILKSISHHKVYAECADDFVQAIARESIIHPDSMLARESGYTGFRAAAVLSDALFGDAFIHKYYKPFGWIGIDETGLASSQAIACLNKAAEISVHAALEQKDFWDPWSHSSMVATYIAACRRTLVVKPYADSTRAELTIGISKILTAVRKEIAKLPNKYREDLYKRSPGYEMAGLIDSIATLGYESLEVISNDFDGYADERWTYAHEIFKSIFPSIIDYARGNGTSPTGCDPLQQRVSIMLLDKLKENMEGFYPSISRVLLSVIGPYGRHDKISDRSAFRLLEDAVYSELRKLPSIRIRRGHSLSDYLPSTTTYSENDNVLLHQYSDGEMAQTHLGKLQFREVDFFSEDMRNTGSYT